MLKKEKLNCKKAIKRPLPYFPLWNISTAAPLARDLILLTLSKILCNLYVFLIEICLQWPFAFEIDFSDSLHFDWTYLHVFAIFIKDIWPTCLFVNKVRYVCNDHLQSLHLHLISLPSSSAPWKPTLQAGCQRGEDTHCGWMLNLSSNVFCFLVFAVNYTLWS